MQYLRPDPETTADLHASLRDVPAPSTDAAAPAALLARCPRAAPTPLVEVPALARQAGIAAVHVKDERGRMGLGSFKALGAAYVIATDAAARGGPLTGVVYVTASAGNHGLSVAAGAQAFGASAVIYLADTVSEAFADRLRALGAEVRRAGTIYEESMAAAQAAAVAEGARLLSDSSWPGYVERPHRLMEGYLVLMAEIAEEIPAPPTHIFLQAGVGGLAGAAAAYARKIWGAGPRIIVVEPQIAPALFGSVAAGAVTITPGPASEMGRLDCKAPSLIALKGLTQDATDYLLISEAEGHAGRAAAAEAGLPTTTSGAAGLAGMLAADPADLALTESSRALIILSEAATA